MKSEKDILVIKWDTDSFERAYNEKLGEYADVISISDIYDVNSKSKKEKKSRIRGFIRDFDREHVLSHYKKIIVFEDLNITWALSRYIENRKTVHLWYWNIIDPGFKDRIKLGLIRRMCSAWTFDEGQAKALGLKHNTQFYIGRSGDDGSDDTFEYDLFFVGLDKGRKNVLDKISSACSANGLKAKIVIAGQTDEKGNTTDLMEYPEVVENIKKSRALLEIGRQDQTGLTVRSLEALFYNRLLVTNNSQIYGKKYFGPENAYILNPNKTDGLAEFIRSAKPEYSPDAYDYYSVKSWLERF